MNRRMLVLIFSIFMLSQIILVLIWLFNDVYDRRNRSSDEREISNINEVVIEENYDDDNDDGDDYENDDDFWKEPLAPVSGDDSMYHDKEVKIREDFVISFYNPDSSREEDKKSQKIITRNETEKWSLIEDEHGHYYKKYDCPNSVHKKNGKTSMYSTYWDMFHTKRALVWMWSEYAKSMDIEWMPWLGSLVGTARDGYVVPWDGDVDITVRRKDLVKLEANPFPTEFLSGRHAFCLAKNWRIVMQERRKAKIGYKGGCAVFGPVARIYDMSRKKKYTEVLEIFTYDVREYDDGDKTVFAEFGGDNFEYDMIYPLRNCTFLSMTVPCPNKPRKVVSQIYDSDFKVPFACVEGVWKRVNDEVNRKPYFKLKESYPGVNKTGIPFRVI